MRYLVSMGYSKRKAKYLSHGHLRRKKDCYKVKETILANKKTKCRDIWKLGCYVRVCDPRSYRHYDWVCGLYETRKNKDKQEFYNIGGRMA